MVSGCMVRRAAIAVLMAFAAAATAQAKGTTIYFGGMPWHGWYVMADEAAVDGPYDSEQDCAAALATTELKTTQPPRCQIIETAQNPILRPVAGYHQWRLFCGTTQTAGHSCNIVQDITDPRTHHAIGQITLWKAARNTTVMTLRLPIDLMLESGLSLKIGAEVHTYPFLTCVTDGCFVRIPVTEELDAQMAKASDGGIAVVAAPGKIITGRFSLTGLAAARAYQP